jgi:septal ring factor EnvC (AmiA/AmiB activator)
MAYRTRSSHPSPPARLRVRGLAVAGVVLLLLGGGAHLLARRALGNETGDALIRQRETELRDLRGKRAATQKRIAELRKEDRALEEILSELERERVVSRQYLLTLEQQVTALERDLAARQVRLDENESELRAMQADLGTLLRHYDRRGRVHAAELLVSSATTGEIFTRTHYWIRLIRNLRDEVIVVREQREQVRTEVQGIEQRRGEVLALRRERSAELQAIEKHTRTVERDRAKLEQSVAQYEVQAAKLLASQKKIEEMLEAARRAAASAGGAGLDALRGRLPWPVRGRVVSRFGTITSPRYGTRIPHKGIGIAAAEGTEIKAVAAGKVIYAGWLEGYGNTVILDHGKGFFTLYAHASRIQVAGEQRVGAGAVVARVGSTDSLTGPGLHFEIRLGAEALDPERWLRGR